tara:strand:- start:32839 stop:33474 length:636 start_codon:yes stop_codon:yes gene_type:complete
MTSALLITALLLVVAIYLAHVRIQSLEGRIAAAQEASVETGYLYEDCAFAIEAWGKKLAPALEEVNLATRTMRMHSAQLKGAGERIRTIEANLASVDKTVSSMLKGLPNDYALPPSRELSVQPRRKVSGSLIDRRVKALRVEILGGQDADGLPITGVVSDLRQQVEGINTNLGRKLATVQRQAGNIPEHVTRVLDARKSTPARLWAWMTGS